MPQLRFRPETWYVSCWEWNLWPFPVPEGPQPTEPHQPGSPCSFWRNFLIKYPCYSFNLSEHYFKCYCFDYFCTQLLTSHSATPTYSVDGLYVMCMWRNYSWLSHRPLHALCWNWRRQGAIFIESLFTLHVTGESK